MYGDMEFFLKNSCVSSYHRCALLKYSFGNIQYNVNQQVHKKKISAVPKN